MTNPDLSVVVPVYRAQQHLEPLAQDILSMDGCTVELILVNDCCPDGSGAVVDALAKRDPRVKALHHTVNKGGGHARNTGFDQARGTYTLFFDADDQIHPKVVVEGVRHLRRTGAALAMFPYTHIRDEGATGLPMSHGDSLIWDALVPAGQNKQYRLSKAPDLLRFTNYPWNKIVSTAEQRLRHLRFGPTRVHNDIVGHWMSLLNAEARVLLIDQVICTHTVLASGDNLTNQRDAQRLVLFDALEDLLDTLEAYPDRRRIYAAPFWEFALDLAAWGRGRIANMFQAEYRLRLQRLVSRINIEDYTRLRLGGHEALADRVSRVLLNKG